MSVTLKVTAWLTLTCDPSEDEAYKAELPPFEAQQEIKAALRKGTLVFDNVEVDAEWELPA